MTSMENDEYGKWGVWKIWSVWKCINFDRFIHFKAFERIYSISKMLRNVLLLITGTKRKCKTKTFLVSLVYTSYSERAEVSELSL